MAFLPPPRPGPAPAPAPAFLPPIVPRLMPPPLPLPTKTFSPAPAPGLSPGPGLPGLPGLPIPTGGLGGGPQPTPTAATMPLPIPNFDPSQGGFPVDPGVAQGGGVPTDDGSGGTVPVGLPQGIPAPPGGVVLPSDVDALKAQIQAKVSRLDGAMAACPAGVIDPNAWQATRTAALAFANSSTLGGILPGLSGGGQDFPAQMAIGQGILQGLDGWEQTLAQKCGLAPAPLPQPVPSQQGGGILGNLAQGAGSGLLGIGLLAAAGLGVVLIFGRR